MTLFCIFWFAWSVADTFPLAALSRHSSGLSLSRSRKEGKEKKSGGFRALSRLGGGPSSTT